MRRDTWKQGNPVDETWGPTFDAIKQGSSQGRSNIPLSSGGFAHRDPKFMQAWVGRKDQAWGRDMFAKGLQAGGGKQGGGGGGVSSVASAPREDPFQRYRDEQQRKEDQMREDRHRQEDHQMKIQEEKSRHKYSNLYPWLYGGEQGHGLAVQTQADLHEIATKTEGRLSQTQADTHEIASRTAAREDKKLDKIDIPESQSKVKGDSLEQTIARDAYDRAVHEKEASVQREYIMGLLLGDSGPTSGKGGGDLSKEAMELVRATAVKAIEEGSEPQEVLQMVLSQLGPVSSAVQQMWGVKDDGTGATRQQAVEALAMFYEAGLLPENPTVQKYLKDRLDKMEKEAAEADNVEWKSQGDRDAPMNEAGGIGGVVTPGRTLEEWRRGPDVSARPEGWTSPPQSLMPPRGTPHPRDPLGHLLDKAQKDREAAVASDSWLNTPGGVVDGGDRWVGSAAPKVSDYQREQARKTQGQTSAPGAKPKDKPKKTSSE